MSMKWDEYRIAFGPMPQEEARGVARRLGRHYFIEKTAEGWCVVIHVDNDAALKKTMFRRAAIAKAGGNDE